MFFASNLKHFRQKRDMTQTDLAELLGTDYNTISRYEKGGQEGPVPRAETLSKIAGIFKISIEELLNVDFATMAQKATVRAAAESENEPKQVNPFAQNTVGAAHPVFITVELDGTASSLQRAMLRLSAINDIVAGTEE